MELQVVTFVERPDLDDRWADTVGPAWPEFLMQDSTVNELWRYLYEIAPEHQFFVIERDSDAVVCVGNSIPFRWDGDLASLPDGIDGVLPLAVEQHQAGVAEHVLRDAGGQEWVTWTGLEFPPLGQLRHPGCARPDRDRRLS
jgi:hypothetical protein